MAENVQREDAEYWFNRGCEFYESGDFEKAIECFEKVIQFKPADTDAFNNLGNALLKLGKIKQDESLFEKSIEKYEKAIELNPDYAKAFYNLGNVLSDLAQIKQEELLFEKSIEKYEKAIELNPTYFIAFNNLGIAFSDLARIKQDEKLFGRAFENYEKAIELNPDYAKAFNNWGIAIADLYKIVKNKDYIKKFFLNFYKKSDSLKKLDKSILEILSFFDDEIINLEEFYPILELQNTKDGKFFYEIVKLYDIKDENKLKKYKEIYVLSIFIINKLHIKKEELVACYRGKNSSQEMLFTDSKLRLNAINYSNDPTEGKILFDYLFENNSVKKTLNNIHGAFAACFTFNHDCLNQFRLYGKDSKEEGTGLSLVFNNDFFSTEAKMAIKQDESSLNDDGKKQALFRCIYIDPITQRVETVGHKENYLFYREVKKNEKKIKVDVKEYDKYIKDTINYVNIKMKKLKDLVKENELRQDVVGQLLINLRYLIKHVAFKEEQECRIVKICDFDDEIIKMSGLIVIDEKDKGKEILGDNSKMYINYEPQVSKHVKKIYFGPKAKGMEIFQDYLRRKKLGHITCEMSQNPLA